MLAQFDDLLRSLRIQFRPQAVVARRIFVLNNDSVIDRIDPLADHRHLVLADQRDAGFVLDKGELIFDGDADVLLGIRHFRRFLHLVGKHGSMAGQQLVQRFVRGHRKFLRHSAAELSGPDCSENLPAHTTNRPWCFART